MAATHGAPTLYSAAMSLDGFIAGPGGDMSWLREFDDEPNPTAARLLTDTGCLLMGGRTFRGDDANRGSELDAAFGGEYDGPSVVLTRQTPAQPVAGVTFSADLHEAVATAKQLAGDRYVRVLGAEMARSCLEARLLDEILVFVAPVLLGDGVRMFEHAGGTRVRLERLAGRDEHWYRLLQQ